MAARRNLPYDWLKVISACPPNLANVGSKENFSPIFPNFALRDQGPVSRKSREIFGPEKPVFKLQSAYFEKLIL